MKITKEELQIIHYGLSWIGQPELSFYVYRDGALDTVAHQLACLISQKYSISVPTNDVLDFLDFNMTVDEITEAVTKYLNQ